MRLIDADALLEEAKRLSGPQTGDGWDNWGVYALIERQKTVDAVLRKDALQAHPEWLNEKMEDPIKSAWMECRVFRFF